MGNSNTQNITSFQKNVLLLYEQKKVHPFYGFDKIENIITITLQLTSDRFVTFIGICVRWQVFLNLKGYWLLQIFEYSGTEYKPSTVNESNSKLNYDDTTKINVWTATL